MRASSRCLALFALAALLPACVYSNVRTPLDEDVQETELGSKEGRATMKSVLWLVAWGDAGTAAAAKDGGIVRVRHLDNESFLLLFGVYASRTTIAYGD